MIKELKYLGIRGGLKEPIQVGKNFSVFNLCFEEELLLTETICTEDLNLPHIKPFDKVKIDDDWYYNCCLITDDAMSYIPAYLFAPARKFYLYVPPKPIESIKLAVALQACDFPDDVIEEMIDAEVSTHYNHSSVYIDWSNNFYFPRFKAWLIETYGERIQEFTAFAIAST